MQQQTANYYRFWLVMVGALAAILSLHPAVGFIAGLALVGAGVVLPLFQGKVMSLTTKVEKTVEQKISERTKDAEQANDTVDPVQSEETSTDKVA